MPQISETYRIDDYRGIRIECWSPNDLVGLHSLLEKEGCPTSENVFTDDDKAVELDEVQRRISQKYHASKLSSADIMLHINGNKLLLCDAKYNLKTLDNLDRKEISKKIKESRALVVSDYSYIQHFYILLKKKLTGPMCLSILKRMLSQNPKWRLVDTEKFRQMFVKE